MNQLLLWFVHLHHDNKDEDAKNENDIADPEGNFIVGIFAKIYDSAQNCERTLS